jgi:transcriptional regulator with XRE-family HTH domain
MTHPPSPAQMRLTAILRGLREAAGMSTYQLAEAVGWSQPKTSRIERGAVRATAADVEAWAEATGADPATREELAALAYSAWTETRSWRSAHRGGLAARQREMGAMDRRASEILHFQPSLIPGLLQSEAYARRVLTFGDVSGRGGIDAAAKERLKRQAVLREPGRAFDYVLTEGALRWRPGPAPMMDEQLAHMVALAALPAVSLSVIPFDRDPASVYLHPFAIFRIPDAPVVLIENYHGESFAFEKNDLDVYERVFAELRESALTGDEALAFIRSVFPG